MILQIDHVAFSTSNIKRDFNILEVLGYKQIFEKINGRIIIGTFASQLARVQKILDLAEKHGRRVYLQGRSMNDNVEIAHQLGYLKFNPRILLRDVELNKIPDNGIKQ